MTDKQHFIIDYFKYNKGCAYYADVKVSIGLMFDNEEEFEKIFFELLEMGIIYKDHSDTLFILKKNV